MTTSWTIFVQKKEKQYYFVQVCYEQKIGRNTKKKMKAELKL